MISVVRVCVGFAGAMAAAACADDGEAAPPPAAETRDSRPGIVQVGDDEGPLLSETEACERFRTGWEEHRQRLDCTVPALAACPHLIRPLASTVCVSYSEESLDTCLERFAAADSCEEVIPGACVLTAVLGVWSPECADEDAGDDAGPGGTAADDASVVDASARDAHAEDAEAAPMTTSEIPGRDAGETGTRSSGEDAAPAPTSSVDSPSGNGASSESAASSGPDVESASAPGDAG